MPDTLSGQSSDTSVLEPQAVAGGSRALVPLALTASSPLAVYSTCRPDPRFVVHLIATAAHAPQTRNLRRAAPDEAAMSYSDASVRNRPPVAANGLTLSLVA